jgi:hypothetical protein
MQLREVNGLIDILVEILAHFLIYTALQQSPPARKVSLEKWIHRRETPLFENSMQSPP